ncbi:hypothetical protein SALBM135S_08052 [Streptomyces alboniger]
MSPDLCWRPTGTWPGPWRTPPPSPCSSRPTASTQHRTVRAQLESALKTRSVIEQAKGFLTARHESDPDTSFRRLRAHARRNHLRLADLSRDIVSGATVLPPPADTDTDKSVSRP